jgi:hypothetical protein
MEHPPYPLPMQDDGNNKILEHVCDNAVGNKQDASSDESHPADYAQVA